MGDFVVVVNGQGSDRVSRMRRARERASFEKPVNLRLKRPIDVANLNNKNEWAIIITATVSPPFPPPVFTSIQPRFQGQ